LRDMEKKRETKKIKEGTHQLKYSLTLNMIKSAFGNFTELLSESFELFLVVLIQVKL